MTKIKKIVGFSLNEEVSNKIDDFKWELKLDRSEVIRRIVNFLGENPEILNQIKKFNESEIQNDKNKE